MIQRRTWRIHSKAVSTIRGRNWKTELFISTVGPTIQERTVTKTELFQNALQRANGEKTELFISTVGPTIQELTVTKTELFISTVGPTIQELTVTKTELF